MSILVASCTKEVKLTKEELLSKALAADPSVKVLLPSSINTGASCSDYSAGCLSAHTVKVGSLEMIVVEFMTEEDALFAAKKYRGFFLKNWFFDDVTGEPSLEKFVTEKLEAKKP